MLELKAVTVVVRRTNLIRSEFAPFIKGTVSSTWQKLVEYDEAKYVYIKILIP